MLLELDEEEDELELLDVLELLDELLLDELLLEELELLDELLLEEELVDELLLELLELLEVPESQTEPVTSGTSTAPPDFVPWKPNSIYCPG